MSEMVTKVAKALAENVGVIWGGPRGEDDPDFALPRAMYFALARAAIEAMRDIPPEMFEAWGFGVADWNKVLDRALSE